MSVTTLHAVDLLQALHQVLPAAGDDPALPHLMGVLIEGKDGSVRLVASDSHRLAIRDLVPSSLDHDFDAVVPAVTLQGWRAHLSEDAEVSLNLDDRNLTLTSSGTQFGALIVPTTFPDYERFLEPVKGTTSAVVDQQRFLSALEGFDDGAILMSTHADRLTLVRREERVEIEATSEGPQRHVAINPAFAADAIRNAVGPEIVVEIEQPLNPVIFRSADDGTYTSLVMPVKLD